LYKLFLYYFLQKLTTNRYEFYPDKENLQVIY